MRFKISFLYPQSIIKPKISKQETMAKIKKIYKGGVEYEMPKGPVGLQGPAGRDGIFHSSAERASELTSDILTINSHAHNQ